MLRTEVQCIKIRSEVSMKYFRLLKPFRNITDKVVDTVLLFSSGWHGIVNVGSVIAIAACLLVFSVGSAFLLLNDSLSEGSK